MNDRGKTRLRRFHGNIKQRSQDDPDTHIACPDIVREKESEDLALDQCQQVTQNQLIFPLNDNLCTWKFVKISIFSLHLLKLPPVIKNPINYF